MSCTCAINRGKAVLANVDLDRPAVNSQLEYDHKIGALWSRTTRRGETGELSMKQLTIKILPVGFPEHWNEAPHLDRALSFLIPFRPRRLFRHVMDTRWRASAFPWEVHVCGAAVNDKPFIKLTLYKDISVRCNAVRPTKLARCTNPRLSA